MAKISGGDKPHPARLSAGATKTKIVPQVMLGGQSGRINETAKGIKIVERRIR